MKQKHITLLVTFVIWLLISAFTNLNEAFCQSRSGSGYQITIYVDEGNDPILKDGSFLPSEDSEWTGHTFIGLSDGKNTEYSGWNVGGVEDSADLESKYISKCQWDVKKTYDITKTGYEKALQEINKWNTDGGGYDLDHHCGHFAHAVAQAAGIKSVGVGSPSKPSYISDLINIITTKPGLFGDHIRKNGGQVAASAFQVNSYENTGLSVKRGDNLKFRASGDVIFGPSIGSAGPEGKTFFLLFGIPTPINADKYNFFTDRPHGSLIGRVKTPRASALADWFYIGEGGEITAGQTGILELNVNDSEPIGNKGKFEVKVTICKAQ